MLSLSSVSASIAGIPILRDISFELKPGLTTVLIGRNGAGKTTLLRTIMGLLPATSGSIKVDGTELTTLPAYARAGLGIGYAPEDRRLIPEFTIEDNVLMPALALKLPRAEAEERLARVYRLLPELEAMRKRPGGGVSGGQGKMVALGRALMVTRSALLLDEPFQGLAPALALEYARTLGRLREQLPELTLFITESSPHLLDDISDEMIRIERGSIETASEAA